MAGIGSAPKSPEQRRNRNPKLRGEWVDLPAENGGPIPRLPNREQGWAERTRQAWSAWWRDPVSPQWTAADVENVLFLAELYDVGAVAARDGERFSAALVTEMRLRMDGLGLTQRGKRDLRWRVEHDAEPAEVSSSPSSSARRDRLKVV